MQGCISNSFKHLRSSFFAKIVVVFQPLTIFAKSFIIDVCQSFELAFAMLFFDSLRFKFFKFL